MKRDTLQSSWWKAGSLAAMLMMGTGSMVVAADFTAYNDLAWVSGQLDTNITKFTSPVGGSGLPNTGLLKDFTTGIDTGVTLTVSGGTFDGSAQGAQGANPTTGDAFTIFNGKVSGLGVLSYIDDVNNSLVLTFSGLNPTKAYDLAFFSHRNTSGWDRASLVTISGQDAFTNTSSVATDNPSEAGGVIFSGPADTSTRLPADNDNGYVARFSQVNPGSDGIVVLTISFDGIPLHQYAGKYGSAVRLVESSTSNTTGHDLDGDGKADLVWRNTNGNTAIWLLNGTAIASSGFPGGVPSQWRIAGVGDVDADGKADVIWHNGTTGTVAVWLMNGLTVTSVGFPGSASTDWDINKVGDVDGDGKADLVWRNTNGNTAIWLLNGTAIASSGFPGGVPSQWRIAGVGDVDADGKADVIWHNGTTGTVAVWLMNGLTVTSVGFPGSASTDWDINKVGDVDGDGKADLVWRNTNGNTAIWLLNGTAIASSGFPGGVPLDWQIAQVGDVDADGKADVIWRNGTTGTVAIWLMNGLSVISTGFPGSATTDWVIQD